MEPQRRSSDQRGMKPFEAVNFFFDQAADIIDLPLSARDLLQTPEKELRVRLPLRRDDGSLDTFMSARDRVLSTSRVPSTDAPSTTMCSMRG